MTDTVSMKRLTKTWILDKLRITLDKVSFVMAYIDISIFGKSNKLTFPDGNKIHTFFESPNYRIKET